MVVEKLWVAKTLSLRDLNFVFWQLNYLKVTAYMIMQSH